MYKPFVVINLIDGDSIGKVSIRDTFEEAVELAAELVVEQSTKDFLTFNAHAALIADLSEYHTYGEAGWSVHITMAE